SSVAVDDVHSGRGTAAWDVAAFPEGTYQLFAVIDDGITSSTHELGSYEVSHANTAPTVTFTAPRPLDIITTEPYDITFEIADPDAGDVLTYSLVARRGSETVSLEADAPATAGTNTFQLPNLSPLAEG